MIKHSLGSTEDWLENPLVIICQTRPLPQLLYRPPIWGCNDSEHGFHNQDNSPILQNIHLQVPLMGMQSSLKLLFHMQICDGKCFSSSNEIGSCFNFSHLFLQICCEQRFRWRHSGKKLTIAICLYVYEYCICSPCFHLVMNKSKCVTFIVITGTGSHVTFN